MQPTFLLETKLSRTKITKSKITVLILVKTFLINRTSCHKPKLMQILILLVHPKFNNNRFSKISKKMLCSNNNSSNNKSKKSLSSFQTYQGCMEPNRIHGNNNSNNKCNSKWCFNKWWWIIRINSRLIQWWAEEECKDLVAKGCLISSSSTWQECLNIRTSSKWICKCSQVNNSKCLIKCKLIKWLVNNSKIQTKEARIHSMYLIEDK